MEVKHHLRVHKEYLRLHMKTAMEYRLNFLFQAGFMILNDLIFLLIIFLLFEAFGGINGYDTRAAVIIYSFVMLTFSIASILYGNRRHIWESIVDGGFDFYLGLPIDELYHALISKWEMSAAGDLIAGLALLIILLPQKILLVLLVAIFGTIALLALYILIDCIGFLMENPKMTTRALSNMVIGYSSWPLSAAGPGPRAFLFITAILFVSTMPYEIVESFSWHELGVLAIGSLLTLTIAVFCFKRCVRRYESGNMITTRV
jgi:ABC-2 type transport system permease protein